MTKLRLFALLLAFAPSLGFAASAGPLESSGTDLSDRLSLHRYQRIADDLGLSPELVEQHLMPADAKIGENINTGINAGDGNAWFGKAPPDLSLTARARLGGPDWIYSYLKGFYVDESRPMGWNNTVFPGASMPHVLWEMQGIQRPVYEQGEDGQTHVVGLELVQPGRLDAKAYDQVARDISAFLQYVAEPAALKRESVGVWVVLFLAFFTFIAYLLKVEYWRDVH